MYLYFLVLSTISSHSYASETKAFSELTDTCDFADGSDEAWKRDNNSVFDEGKSIEDKSTNVKIEKYQKQHAQKLTFEDEHELCSYWASEGESILYALQRNNVHTAKAFVVPKLILTH